MKPTKYGWDQPTRFGRGRRVSHGMSALIALVVLALLLSGGGDVAAATAPSAPGSIMATPGNASATVTWALPSTDGGSTISYYIVSSYLYQASGATSVYRVNAFPASAVCTTSPCRVTISNLVNGNNYHFTVKAVNAVGQGPESNPSVCVTPSSSPPPSPPGAPTAVEATAGNASAAVTWTAPTSSGGGAITYYYVATYRNAGNIPTLYKVSGFGAGSVCSATPCHATITGLYNGGSFRSTVTAANSAGEGLESAPSTWYTPAGPPTAPTNVAATAGSGSITVTWTRPAANGSTITSYVVTVYQGTTTTIVETVPFTASVCPTMVCSATVSSGLTAGQPVSVTVKASNAIGTSGESARSAVVTPGGSPPGPPQAVAAVPGAPGTGTATIMWMPPASDGGSAISRYVVTPYDYNGGNPIKEPSATFSASTSCMGSVCEGTDSGLVPGHTYYFVVAAVNATMQGSDSSPSANIMLPSATTPSAPLNVTAVAGAGRTATVTWQPPASDGGSPITDYDVYEYYDNGGNPTLDGAWSDTPATWCTSSGCSYTISGLATGSMYRYTVKAVNAIGSGPESTPSAWITGQ